MVQAEAASDRVQVSPNSPSISPVTISLYITIAVVIITGSWLTQESGSKTVQGVEDVPYSVHSIMGGPLVAPLHSHFEMKVSCRVGLHNTKYRNRLPKLFNLQEI